MTFALTLDSNSTSLSLLPFTLTLTLDLHSDAFIYEVPALLSVGQRVSALHPTKGILGVGSVLIVDGDEVRCVGYQEMGKVGVAGKWEFQEALFLDFTEKKLQRRKEFGGCILR